MRKTCNICLKLWWQYDLQKIDNWQNKNTNTFTFHYDRFKSFLAFDMFCKVPVLKPKCFQITNIRGVVDHNTERPYWNNVSTLLI